MKLLQTLNNSNLMDNFIRENLLEIKKNIPDNVTLVAVSKFNPEDAIMEAYSCGQRIFGESKVQELTTKYLALPKDIKWHFIGHLQTNKVKFIIPFITLIHSLDSLKLFSEINKVAKKENKIIDVLLQLHIADEETKYGFSLEECNKYLSESVLQNTDNVRIRGIMGMATYTENTSQIRSEFKILKRFFDMTKETYFKDVDFFDTLSYGMSNDYKIAIEEGSNMVRVGSSIFGERNY